ncbi:NAD-dependent epimerase/dehydratase family protein [Cribrihabitans neustonicus]|uniref:NAD-dependent epimerase/dehydratase family protein n=1 Tax=Cribrihabitans neustonicus TaxID=1429085 RepID=UPI003B5A6821
MAFPAVAVLGATGRIGRLLQRQGAAGLDLRLQARAPQPGSPAPGSGWHIFDPLADPAALARFAAGAQVLLCLAGPVPGRGSGGMEAHIRLGEAAVRAAAAAGAPGARVLLASSAAVYGSRPGLLTEEAPLAPANAYGAAKAEMEARAQALGEALGVAVTSLRIGNVAGFDAILGGWRPGFRLDRFADGQSPRRSYIGPLCLARVLAELLMQPGLPAVLNLAQPGAVEMAALLRAAGRAFSWQAAPAGAIPAVELGTARLQALLPGPLPPADPGRLAAEWAALEPHSGPEQTSAEQTSAEQTGMGQNNMGQNNMGHSRG